jgi:hypothetical protein
MLFSIHWKAKFLVGAGIAPEQEEGFVMVFFHSHMCVTLIKYMYKNPMYFHLVEIVTLLQVLIML